MAVEHQPVLVKEVLEFLQPKPAGVYVDVTCGLGGHAAALLECLGPEGKIIATDRDAEALDAAKARFPEDEKRIRFFKAEFAGLEEVMANAGVEKADGILADLGVSNMQLTRAERGFSFLREGPLDMRMDPASGEPVGEKLKRAREHELETILREYGEERRAPKIARAVAEAARQGKLKTTLDLSETVASCFPPAKRPRPATQQAGRYTAGGQAAGRPSARHGRIHPATRTFQALRIWVNRELESLEALLEIAPRRLAKDGRFCVISYHSLEDRRVKWKFRELAAGEGGFEILTKKPVVPGEEEVRANRKSRSAKLRGLRKK